jgi:hypothetical protein
MPSKENRPVKDLEARAKKIGISMPAHGPERPFEIEVSDAYIRNMERAYKQGFKDGVKSAKK